MKDLTEPQSLYHYYIIIYLDKTHNTISGYNKEIKN